jgi:hypothetical protein
MTDNQTSASSGDPAKTVREVAFDRAPFAEPHHRSSPHGVRTTLQQRIDAALEMDSQLDPPSPEQLVEWLVRSQIQGEPADEREIAMARIVRAAERGGEAHMEAVAGWIGQLPPPPPDSTAVRYEMRDGRMQAAWHDNSILLELRIRLGGRMFTARETVDPFMYLHRFNSDDAQFEDYLRYFIRKCFGEISVADEESYRHFRSLLWVVHPTDQHDLRRCADSGYSDLWCEGGLITRSAYQAFGSSARPVGTCPCRCHRAHGGDGTAEHFRSLGLPVFDEDSAQ